ncbi:hypothetical protein EPH05_02045 [Ureaplasma urealyticum]|uniref:hypothetical protein n=1 Tax=Ureaplasma urealyticum TaxID=2130 RepID=UPI001189BEF6|nr:hypothetical protein [Ureaplasma urealyticum]QDQ70131.1 hypothetical protein EPH05_02045 [Ureaplasma urealyticum]
MNQKIKNKAFLDWINNYSSNHSNKYSSLHKSIENKFIEIEKNMVPNTYYYQKINLTLDDLQDLIKFDLNHQINAKSWLNIIGWVWNNVDSKQYLQNSNHFLEITASNNSYRATYVYWKSQLIKLKLAKKVYQQYLNKQNLVDTDLLLKEFDLQSTNAN